MPMTSMRWMSTLMLISVAVGSHAATIHPRYYSEAELHQMDRNLDNKVTKQEFLEYSEQAFELMVLVDGVVVLKPRTTQPMLKDTVTIPKAPKSTQSMPPVARP